MRQPVMAAVLIAIGGFYLWKFVKRDRFDGHLFESRRHGFSLRVPVGWQQLDEDDLLTTTDQMMLLQVDTKFFLSPGDPNEALLFLTTIDVDENRLSMIDLESTVAGVRQQGVTPEVQQEFERGGHLVYCVAGPYSEDRYMYGLSFVAGSAWVMIQFHGSRSAYGDAHNELEQMMDSISAL